MAQELTQLAVREAKAAQLLDLPASEFRRLVGAGALPGPINIGGHDRWRVDEISAILSGKASRPQDQDFEL